MIRGIGVDAVEISRFADWHSKPEKELEKIFSKAEIKYCLENKTLSAERFAARFAAKEACLKAIQALQPTQKLSLPALAKEIEIAKNGLGMPSLIFRGSLSDLQDLNVHLSLTHTSNLAIAFITLEKP